MNRRTFLIRLGASVAGGISGFFLVPRWPAVAMAADPQPPSPRPRLKDDIVFGRYEGMDSISYGIEGEQVLCAVNHPGLLIVDKLDGRHTIDGIGAAVKTALGLAATEDLDAQIAGFVAQLGALGFLAEPFYATLYYENTHTDEG